MASQLFARKPLEVLLEEMKGEHRLRRVLGPLQLTSLGVGAIIGGIAGGGKGAAIGMIVGGAGGAHLRHALGWWLSRSRPWRRPPSGLAPRGGGRDKN